MNRVMIMAGGTGGHVYPGLAVARVLHHEGCDVVWMGTRQGLEARVVPRTGIPVEWIAIKGLRGRGLLDWCLLPLRLTFAMTQAFGIFLRRRPGMALSMGGFVAGPGGLVAWLLRRPLVIHEANAIPGFTNRWLSLLATRVLTGFPGTFGNRPNVRHVGNPVRPEILAIPAPRERLAGRQGPLRLLVVGGSQGAQALNQTIAETVVALQPEQRPDIWHQCGPRWISQTAQAYGSETGHVRLVEFIEDMAEAYAWSDIVLCRAGAMTVSELAVAGVGSILVPYPFATDDHQTANARFLCVRNAAVLLPETQCTPARLQELLTELAANRELLLKMAVQARSCSMPDADNAVAHACREAIRA